MKYLICITAVFAVLLLSFSVKAENTDPRKLIVQMTDATGSYNDLKSLNDVEYTYTVKNVDTGKSDISIEQYIFDGELSWGKFLQRGDKTFPDLKGEII